MKRIRVRFWKTTALLGGLLVVAAPAIGQESVGAYYGVGTEGTIGRGTDFLPDGPSARFGSSLFNPSANRGTFYYRSGYSAPFVSRPVSAPYLTNRSYAPGDGYRYPLYYNPATRAYFYYPVRR